MKTLKRVLGSSYVCALSLLALRWAAGIIFLSHGLPKLQHGPEWMQAFRHMGFPGFFAYIAGVIESVGGGLLIIGLCSRYAAAVLALEMMVAFLRVDLPAGPLLEVGNYELSMILVTVSIALTVYGAGTLSADHWLAGSIRAPRATNAAELSS
jgi:putative oxidoreductase